MKNHLAFVSKWAVVALASMVLPVSANADDRKDHRSEGDHNSSHSSRSSHGSSHADSRTQHRGPSQNAVASHGGGRSDRGDQHSSIQHSSNRHVDPQIASVQRGYAPHHGASHGDHYVPGRGRQPYVASSHSRSYASPQFLSPGRVVTHSSSRSSHGSYANRSNYVLKREHHSSDWYRSNGWHYDRNYWSSHHQHRYYNDFLGCSIIDPYGVPFYDDYDYAPDYNYAVPSPLVSVRAYDYDTRVAVQEELARSGYYDGPIDGDIGPGTRSAIADFQNNNALPVTGRIDERLIDALGLR